MSVTHEVDSHPSAKGLAIIITNDYIGTPIFPQKLDELPGTVKDGESLSKTFTSLQFVVHWEHNVTKKRLEFIMYEVKNLKHKKLKDYKCIVLVFSGHGTTDNYVYMYDHERVHISNQLIDPLLPKHCTELGNIPKLFFIDACRGSKTLNTVLVPRGKSASEDPFLSRGLSQMQQLKVPEGANFLVAYSIMPNYKAYEDGSGGIWLRLLAETIMKSPGTSILDVLTDVNRQLTEMNQSKDFAVQQPEKTDRLNKKVVLLDTENEQAPDGNLDSTQLTDSHHADLLTALLDIAFEWRKIGTYLGFRDGELSNIQGNLMHVISGNPAQNWLGAMLTDWYQWCPGDGRGSKEKATLGALKRALLRANHGALADELNTKLHHHLVPITPIGLYKESEKHLDAVEQAMERKGTLDHTIMQGVYLGPARSGKSSLIKRLTGEGPSSISPSTGVAEEPCHIQVRQSYSVPLSVTDSMWFKLTYNTEAVELLYRIAHFHSPHYANTSQSDKVLDHGSKQSNSPEDSKKTRDLYNASSPPQEALSEEPTPSQTSLSENSTSVQTTDSQEPKLPQTTPLPDGYKSPMEILRAATSGEDISSYLENSWSLYLTDTGGQMEFQELLPLLVSGPSVFFITFRLNQDLSQIFTIQYELPDGSKSEPYESTLTLLEAILTSLASISSMGSFIYKGLQKQLDPIRPKVFFVGTHKDQLDPATAENLIQEIDQYLQEVITSTSHYREGLIQFASPSQLIFTVNNLAEDDTDFKKIKLAVEELVQRGEFKVSSPSHWLIFSLVLRYLPSRIISFEQCLSVAKECGIEDEAELKEALFYLHTKLGVVRYFPVEGLDRIVVKDPQLLFDKVTELIVRTFTFKNVDRYSTDEFKKKGIFSLVDFERISGGSNPLLTPALLVKLLQHLRIIASFKTEDGETKFFIPCVLSHAKASDLTLASQQSEIRPLVITFKCGYCPKGVSGSLIAYLLANEMQSEFEWSLQTNEIFRDQVSFLVGPDFDTITVMILPTNIKVACVPGAQGADRVCSIEDVCSEVHLAVVKGVEKVASDMNYLNYAKHSVTFECPCKIFSSNSHVAEMSMYKGKPSKLFCRQIQKRFCLPPGCLVWFRKPPPTPPINSTTNTISSAIGNSPQLTVTPRSQWGSQTTHLAEIVRLVLPVASKWKTIGILLKITPGKLETIAMDNPKCEDCLHVMLSCWLQQVQKSSTWKTDLADAIEPFDPSLSQLVNNL